MDDYLTRNLEVKSKKTNRMKAVLLIFSGILVILLVAKMNSQRFINPVIESHALSAVQIKIDKGKKIPTEEIKAKIDDELESATGTYSIYFYDFLTGDNFGINEQMVLTAASINKIPILASLYYYAGKGIIDLEKMVTLQQKDIQDYGTGSIRYQKPGSTYSIKTLARLMMEQSDNTAAYLLGTEIIGLNEIQKTIEVWGLAQTDMKNNKSSIKDIFLVMKKMYKGEVTTPSLTREMIDFMDDSDFEDRIPRGIPANISVYHKTGDEVGKIHDAGIVELPGRPYYLGIMTTDITDEESTKSKMARISQIVFASVANL